MGQLDRLTTEIPESAMPLVPKNWGELNTVTIAFGHGMAVAPLQAVMAVGALMNGGKLIPPTFLKRSEAEAAEFGKQVVKPETSDRMRYLMRLNAEKGSAKKVDIPGYYVGGKTGTAEKVVNGHYSKTKLLATFMAVFPADQPRYLVTIMLDEPTAARRKPRALRPRAGMPRRPRAWWSSGSRPCSASRRASICRPPIARFLPVDLGHQVNASVCGPCRLAGGGEG